MARYTGSDKRLQYLFRASGNLAEDYNDTSTYAVGDFAIVDGVLKKCITAVSTPESYDSTKWTNALITDEMGSGGGGGTNSWTGTRAEYEQVAETIPNGTQVNFTDDMISAVIASYDIYSTEEREVGVWTDGKPLYQKTYLVTFTSDAFDITIDSNIEIKEIFGGIDSANKTDFIHIGYGGSSADSVQAYRNSSTNVRFQNKYYSSRPNGIITLKYTKTTDNAGSGAWLPSGEPSHHYSADEKVIGTWTDGSTLYEKTLHIPFSDLSTDGVQRVYSLANALPNTVIRNAFGMAISASYGYCSLGSMCYRQNTQSGTYWQFYWYYNLLALRSSNGITELNSSIKPDIDITLQYTKTT